MIAKAFSGTPQQWNQSQIIGHARLLESGSLKEIGSPLVGSYFKQRYPSSQLCQSKEGLVVRESALTLYKTTVPNAGITVHVDVCQTDLDERSNEGVTYERTSHDIILSLRQR